MMLLHVQLLVVLAPALVGLVLCGVANRGALRALFAIRFVRAWRSVLANREHVSTLISLATNLVFIGSGVGVLYGSNGDALLDQEAGVLLGVVGMLVVVALSRRAATLAKRAAQEEAQALQAALRDAIAAHRQDAQSNEDLTG